MIVILCSTQDMASMTIRQALLDKDSFLWRSDGVWENHEAFCTRLQGKHVRLLTTDIALIHYEQADALGADLIIYASKHQSASKIPSLCVHTQGNWSQADYGGKPQEISVWPAHTTRCMYDTLKQCAPEGLDVVYEATHHGPYSLTPGCFIEIGSDQTQWQRYDLACCLAQAIFASITQVQQYAHMPTAIGIGGLHTVPRLTAYAQKNNFALGHICPHYQLEHLNSKVLQQAIQRTTPKPQTILIDWKGLRTHKQHVMHLVDTLQTTAPEEFTIIKVK